MRFFDLKWRYKRKAKGVYYVKEKICSGFAENIKNKMYLTSFCYTSKRISLIKTKNPNPLPIGIKFGFLHCGMKDNNGFSETIVLRLFCVLQAPFLKTSPIVMQRVGRADALCTAARQCRLLSYMRFSCLKTKSTCKGSPTDRVWCNTAEFISGF